MALVLADCVAYGTALFMLLLTFVLALLFGSHGPHRFS